MLLSTEVLVGVGLSTEVLAVQVRVGLRLGMGLGMRFLSGSGLCLGMSFWLALGQGFG